MRSLIPFWKLTLFKFEIVSFFNLYYYLSTHIILILLWLFFKIKIFYFSSFDPDVCLDCLKLRGLNSSFIATRFSWLWSVGKLIKETRSNEKLAESNSLEYSINELVNCDLDEILCYSNQARCSLWNLWVIFRKHFN